MRTFLTIATLAALAAPISASAQSVKLIAPDASDSLETTLQAASLSLSLEQDGGSDAQDFVAAARADYRRLLTGLYSEGFYGGTISILVDGIEASTLDPLVPRSSVSTIELLSLIHI